MRLKAYILAADPAWIEASVLSYYDLVEEIIVSYDANRMGWTGVPVEADECLARLKAIDRDGKMRYCPGHYARLDCQPLDNDTFQRQCALNEASKDADWVIQFDTDEVASDPATLLSCIEEANSKGFDGVDYPARWIYRQLGNHRYLESCSRLWRVSAGYPGPLAVRAGTQLRLARQCEARLFRVDFRAYNTDGIRLKTYPVHRVIQEGQGVIHFAWVRDELAMRRKSQSSSHARDFDWKPEIDRWEWCGKHPYLTALQTPIQRGPRQHIRKLRICAIVMPLDINGNVLDG